MNLNNWFFPKSTQRQELECGEEGVVGKLYVVVSIIVEKDKCYKKSTFSSDYTLPQRTSAECHGGGGTKAL